MAQTFLQLQDLCRARGLKPCGLKDELAIRLLEQEVRDRQALVKLLTTRMLKWKVMLRHKYTGGEPPAPRRRSNPYYINASWRG